MGAPTGPRRPTRPHRIAQVTRSRRRAGIWTPAFRRKQGENVAAGELQGYRPWHASSLQFSQDALGCSSVVERLSPGTSRGWIHDVGEGKCNGNLAVRRDHDSCPPSFVEVAFSRGGECAENRIEMLERAHPRAAHSSFGADLRRPRVRIRGSHGKAVVLEEVRVFQRSLVDGAEEHAPRRIVLERLDTNVVRGAEDVIIVARIREMLLEDSAN